MHQEFSNALTRSIYITILEHEDLTAFSFLYSWEASTDITCIFSFKNKETLVETTPDSASRDRSDIFFILFAKRERETFSRIECNKLECSVDSRQLCDHKTSIWINSSCFILSVTVDNNSIRVSLTEMVKYTERKNGVILT